MIVESRESIRRHLPGKTTYMTSYLATAGYPVLALAVLIGALGAPLPLSAVLAAAAALARQGHLQLTALFVICVGAALIGDCLGYLIGRHGLSRIPLAARLRFPGQRYFGRFPLGVGLFGSMALLIFVTRWAVTLPAPFVNVVAGARRYPWHRFLVADLTGEALWVALSLAPGYLLGGIGPAGTALAVAFCLVPLLIAGLARSRMTPAVA
jgi:membrane-associated protein